MYSTIYLPTPYYLQFHLWEKLEWSIELRARNYIPCPHMVLTINYMAACCLAHENFITIVNNHYTTIHKKFYKPSPCNFTNHQRTKSNFHPRFFIANQLRLLPHLYSLQHLWVPSHFHYMPLNQSHLQVL